MIRQVAVVPSTPLILGEGLPGAPDPDVRRLGQAARRVVAGMALVDVVVVLAGGVDLDVVPVPPTELAGYGLSDLAVHLLAAPPAEVVDRLRASASASASLGAGVRGDAVAAGEAGSSRADVDGASREGINPDLAVLARLLPAGCPTVGVVVPSDVDPERAHTIAVALAQVGEDHSVGVLVAGDLGAGHGPKPPRPQAHLASRQLDDTVIAALDNGRPADLITLDPTVAAASHSRAVGALRVLGGLLDLLRIGTVVRATGAPFGVGYVVAQGG